MVVLTIVTKKNREEIYFEDHLPEANYVRLLSCSFYNSWHNPSSVGTIFFKETGKVIASLPEGYYNLESITKELKSSFDAYKSGAKLVFETNKPNSALTISNKDLSQPPKEISVDYRLANLLGIGRTLRKNEYVRKLNSPSCFLIYCDLIDPRKNFFNGKKSNLLAKVDVRGKPYEKVTYNIDSSQKVFRDASTSEAFNQITISVRDENGELFDFEGLPLEFELEIK